MHAEQEIPTPDGQTVSMRYRRELDIIKMVAHPIIHALNSISAEVTIHPEG